jgi:hypothetical protein
MIAQRGQLWTPFTKSMESVEKWLIPLILNEHG